MLQVFKQNPAPRTLEEALTQQAQGTKAEIALAKVNAIRIEWNELRERLGAKDEQMHLNSDYHQDWDENCHQDWDEDCHQDWDENFHQDWEEDCQHDWNEDCQQEWTEDCHQDWDEICHQDWDENCQQDWTEDCHNDWDSGLRCEENGRNCRNEEDAAEGRNLG
uniref:Uncharacterized protein n=1 Tax=Globodera rostochiensis TaxID=31243 RepID=A0A914IDP0_GLORO